MEALGAVGCGWVRERRRFWWKPGIFQQKVTETTKKNEDDDENEDGLASGRICCRIGDALFEKEPKRA